MKEEEQKRCSRERESAEILLQVFLSLQNFHNIFLLYQSLGSFKVCLCELFIILISMREDLGHEILSASKAAFKLFFFRN